jgi:hypothetical protein
MRIDLLSNTTVVGRAIDFINKHRGLLDNPPISIEQNKEIRIDDAEPIASDGR